MGGRGTFASGNLTAFRYKTVDIIEGVKVLTGLEGNYRLPEESHSSRAYIKLKSDGTFHMMRIYDNRHYLRFELAYHPEPSIDPSRKPVLHYHRYDRHFRRTKAKKATDKMKNHFKKYLKGVIL